MFKFFNKKVTQEFTVDERQELIKDYLYRADDLANSYQYNRKPYIRGGIEQLDQFIADLQTISTRIKQLETAEMIEKRTNYEKLLDTSK